MNNQQQGPPAAADALAAVIADATYKDGWTFRIEAGKARPTEQYAGSTGLTVCIHAVVPNSVKPGETTYVEHWFAPPPTSWGRAAWVRWLLDRIIDVEAHEAMEFYRINGKAPYFPAHGPGRDPYECNLTASEIDRRRDDAAYG